MKPLNILMVTPKFPPDMGGVENHVAQVAPRLVARGNSVTVFTTNGFGRYPSHEVVGGATIRRFLGRPAGKDWYFCPELYVAMGEEDWDIVHVQSYHTLIAPTGMLGALTRGTPYVLTFHGGGHSSRWRNTARPFQWLILRPLVRRAARLVALAHFEVELYGKAFGVPAIRFVSIPNGADLVDRSLVAHVRPDPNLVVSTGRLEKYKGHQKVIAALPDLVRLRPAVRLKILGSGPYEPELRALAGDLGVGDRVSFESVPMAERITMASRLREAGLVVLMSEYETHPLAAIEAINLGCSMIVADVPGLSETAEGGQATTVPLEIPPHDLALVMNRQLDEPLSPEGARTLSWDQCAQRLEQLYRDVCDEKRRKAGA